MSIFTRQPVLASDLIALPKSLGPHRAEDYWKLPEGEPVELIRGNFVMSPSPVYLHQAISLCLSALAHEWTKKGNGRAAAAPMDVVLSDASIVQPDLVYVSKDRQNLVRNRIEGAPDLVVEIISPQHATRDRSHKLALYAEHGVPEYWIVDPAERHIEFLLLNASRYQVEPLIGPTYTSPRLPEVTIDLQAFWKDVERLVD